MSERIGLVLAGGGARGAYELGVLSELLPWLEKRDQRPEIIVGTSIGALNAAYLAANVGRDTPTVLREGCNKWRSITYRKVLEPLLSPGELSLVMRLLLSPVIPRLAPLSLLDPAPLRRTLPELITFGDIHRNIAPNGPLSACGVVATAAHTNRTVVFHDGGSQPGADKRRGIDYVSTQITEAHVRASAAIPAVFPPAHVPDTKRASGWYFDGGTRVNTPIKPALALGADRVIVIGLNSVAPAPSSSQLPDLFDGASQIVQGLLIDPLVRDVETLATINDVLLAPGASPGGRGRVIPYILVAPRTANQIGQIAQEVYNQCYGRLRWIKRSRDLAFLGRAIGASRNSTHGELFSYLFFEPEFAKRLIELGSDDAKEWKRTHEDDPWEVHPLPR